MVPLYNDTQIPDLEQGAIGRFIHKLGNHFQLLNLVINSLRKTVSESRETAVLEETVVKAIELTRTFSEYCQTPTRISIINLFDIIDAAAVTHSASFPGKEVTFDQRIDDSLRGVRIHGDPYLLELALGSVLKNAFEATPVGGIVALHALAERCGDHKPIVRISVVDSGSGIETKNVDRVKAPFYTSKKDHDGLGLSMAVRFVQMHGGVLRVKSREGGGTEVEITLPAEPQES
jgi:signal transduction histidine kinase